MPAKMGAGCCEMCGTHVDIRQKAHILAEAGTDPGNILALCPSCHVRLDTRLKPRLAAALRRAGVEGLPPSWGTSIYQQAATASAAAREKSKRAEATRRGWADPEIRARRVAGIRGARRTS